MKGFQPPLKFAKKYVSADWVARQLGVSRSTVFRLIEEGRIETHQIRAHGWHRIPYDSAIAYISRVNGAGEAQPGA